MEKGASFTASSNCFLIPRANTVPLQTATTAGLRTSLRRRACPLNPDLFQYADAMIRLLGHVPTEQPAVFGFLGTLSDTMSMCLLLPLDGGRKIACLGVRGGQRRQGVWHLPAGQLACSGRRGNGLHAIADFGVRTSRQDPGSTLLPFGVVWFEPGRAVQVRERSSKLAPLEKDPGAHPQMTRGRGVESNGLVQIFQGFFMFAVREEVDSARL